MNTLRKYKQLLNFKFFIVAFFVALAILPFAGTTTASATVASGSGGAGGTSSSSCTNGSKYCCGGKFNKADNSYNQVDTAIDIGCRAEGNPIMDMLFAVLRVLSDGVGLVIVGSIIFGGIQYTMSAGDPQATAKAVGRIRATILALVLYIFAYPLLNWLLPAGFF